MKRFLFSVCALALISGAAFADVPDPSNCTCTLDATGRLLMIPGGPVASVWQKNTNADFSLIVRNAANAPINNCVVEVLVGGQAGLFTGLCSYQSMGLIRNTDAGGNVSFNVQGGGCYKHQPDACTIRGNGVIIRTYDMVMSPDYTGTDDNGLASRWSLTVTPSDLASFVVAYQGGIGPASCHDYDGNNAMNAGDFSIFGAVWDSGLRNCP